MCKITFRSPFRILPAVDQKLRDLLLVAAGALLVALLAQVRIPLPFTPIPLTGQTFAVLLVGAALGSKRGFVSLGLYTGLGLARLCRRRIRFGLHPWPDGRLPVRVYPFRLHHRPAGRARTGTKHPHLPPALPGRDGDTLRPGRGLAGLLCRPTGGTCQRRAPFLPGDVIKLTLAATTLPAAWKLVK